MFRCVLSLSDRTDLCDAILNATVPGTCAHSNAVLETIVYVIYVLISEIELPAQSTKRSMYLCDLPKIDNYNTMN